MCGSAAWRPSIKGAPIEAHPGEQSGCKSAEGHTVDPCATRRDQDDGVDLRREQTEAKYGRNEANEKEGWMISQMAGIDPRQRRRLPYPRRSRRCNCASEKRCTGIFGARTGHRFYNPDAGRWLNRDPIEEEGGFNGVQKVES